MLLNKVLFVSLLVLGLFYIQPAQCEGQRLNTRIAGGFQAQPNQFPYVVLITYLYTDATQGGIKLTYQGTGTIYDTNLVVTSANAVQRFITECATTPSGLMTVAQSVTKINTPAGALVYQVPCSAVKSGFTAAPTTPTYFGDVASITVPAPGFTAQGSVLRLPTSSPTAADINNLWIVGYGESFPGAGPNPQLTYAPINPMRNRLCDSLLKQKTSLGNPAAYKFSENFCLLGQKPDNRTGGVTDACVLDAGAPVIRTKNITNSVPDFEVVGWVNFGTCTAAVPVIATYIFKYAAAFGGTFLPAQVAAPAAGSPANPRAFDGNFACGDGIVNGGALEKCDPSATVLASPELLANSCCDIWTCQFKAGGSVCSQANNGTKCKTQPICNGIGKCKSRDKTGAGCSGKNTRCINGKCINTITKAVLF